MTDRIYDHPFDLEQMGRDLRTSELQALSDHELAELFRDMSRGVGSIDLYERLIAEMAQRFDEYEETGRIGNNDDTNNSN